MTDKNMLVEMVIQVQLYILLKQYILKLKKKLLIFLLLGIKYFVIMIYLCFHLEITDESWFRIKELINNSNDEYCEHNKKYGK